MEERPSWFYVYKLELPKEIQNKIAEEIILREWIEEDIEWIYQSVSHEEKYWYNEPGWYYNPRQEDEIQEWLEDILDEIDLD